MKIQAAYNIFMRVYDKYRQEGIALFEFAEYVNLAQVVTMRKCTYDNKLKRHVHQEPVKGLGDNQYNIEQLQSLVVSIPVDPRGTLTTDVYGRVEMADIEAYFPDDVIRGEMGVIETKKPEVFHVASAARYCTDDGKMRMAQWVRHNDWEAIQENPFRTPTEFYPGFRYFDDHLKFAPEGTRDVQLTVIRMPRHVWIDESGVNDVDPELNDKIMYDVIFEALSLAGITIREPDFYKMIENEKLA